jgi:hypothetical protein
MESTSELYGKVILFQLRVYLTIQLLYNTRMLLLNSVLKPHFSVNNSDLLTMRTRVVNRDTNSY